jgi:multicomponent Na+:H+ antiporter subunit D
MGGRAFLWLAKHPIQAIDRAVGEIYRVGGLIPTMIGARLVALFDNNIIDGLVDGVASSIRDFAGQLRLTQRGSMQENLTFAFAACVILALVFIFVF